MMGASCSLQRHHNHRRRRHSHHDGRGDTTRDPRRHRSHILGGVTRFRTFPFCDVSQDGSSEDERPTTMCSMKRAARHSIDTEVPNQAISTLYSTDDNYELHPTDSTRRCPKSLTDLCIDTVCRSLPNLDGELPVGLPKEIVDRILQSLTSHAALNSTTLRALRKCDLNKLSLANCRGVSDEWLLSLATSSGSSVNSNRSSSSSGSSSNGIGDSTDSGNKKGRLPASPSSNTSVGMFNPSYGSGPKLPSLGDAYPTQWPNPSNPDGGDYPTVRKNKDNDDALIYPALQNYMEGSNADDTMDGFHTDNSYESCSSASFLSASSRPHSPLLYPSKCAPMTLSSSPWLQRSVPADGGIISNEFLSTYNMFDEDDDELSRIECDADSRTAGGGAASSLTLLDLRGSQRLTDRGLLQLSHTPLRTLEVALLDNCHGITGRGLIAFAKSHRLRVLSISNCRRLTDEAVVNVSHLGPSLVALNLGGCRCVTGRSLEALSGMVKLQRLDLSQCEFITDDDLVNLHDLSLIEELSLGWCRSISDVGLGILAEQPNRSQALRTLRLARCSITDAGLNHLKKLENMEELDLNGCDRISSAALGEVLGTLVNLSSLDVSYCPRILSSSWHGKINALKSLELCYSGVRDSHVFNLRSLPMLEELNLDSCVVGDSGIAHLVDNNVMPNLNTLDLADTNISDVAMSKIAQFKEMRHLSLFYCNVSNRGLRYLSSMKNLEVLNLDSRDIGDEGLKHLSGLHLKSLDLFSSRITDIGCAYLSKIKTLTSLELCGGGIGDWGCAHLASLHNLTSLNLSQNESITNRGAAALAALTNLKALNLSNTRVNSDALRFLGGLLKLQSLALYGCTDIVDSPKLSSLHCELPLLRCLRLNIASNEDGVIDHTNGERDSDADVEDSEGEEVDGEVQVGEIASDAESEDLDGDDDDDADDEDDGDEDMDHDEELFDDPFNVVYNHVAIGDSSVESSDEDSAEDFHDAYNDVESIDSNQTSTASMDVEI